MSLSNIIRRRETAPERVQAHPAVTPLVDVYENQDELLVLADVPGATKDGMSVHFDKGHLVIEAKRTEKEPGKWLFGSAHTTDYHREFSVPQGIDASRVEAELANGILRVHLPKSEGLKPRRIDVKAG